MLQPFPDGSGGLIPAVCKGPRLSHLPRPQYRAGDSVEEEAYASTTSESNDVER